MVALQGKPKQGAPLLGTFNDMYRKALEIGVFLHRGPVGDHDGDFKKKVRFYQETLFAGECRYM